MKVYAYHQPVAGLPPADRLIELWKRNWSEHGFEPVILSEKDAKDHPGYDYFVSRVCRFPTSNPRDYERACFVRHLAMANREGNELIDPLLLVDYDVFNRTFTTEHAEQLSSNAPLLLEPTCVPCAVLGTATAFETICDVLCEYVPNGETHISDMTILRKTSHFQVHGSCVEHLDSGRNIIDDPGDGWKTAPLIHFSNFSFSKLGWRGDKADLIQRVLATL